MRTVNNNPVPVGNLFTIILLIVKFFLLFVALTFALVSLGVLADKNNDIKKITENSPFSDHYCILLIDDDQGFSSNSIYQFVIVGQATVSFLILAALVTIVLAVIIKRRYCTTYTHTYYIVIITCHILQFNATVFNIVVIFVITLAVLMSLIVAIVISSGLSKTCKTLIETCLFKKLS